MYKIIGLVFVLAVFGFALACGNSSGSVADLGTSGDSPTEAYKRLYTAVKSKNTESIKAVMTSKSLEFAEMAASKNSTPIEKVFENGFTATTFAEKLPEIRDMRMNGDMGAVEVYNSKDSRWEDLPFVRVAKVRFNTSGNAKANALEAIKKLGGLKISDKGDALDVEGEIQVSEAAELRTKLAEAGVDLQVEVGGWKFAVGDLFAGSFVSPGKGRDFREKEAANAQGGGPVPAANIPMNANVIVPKAAVNTDSKAK